MELGGIERSLLGLLDAIDYDKYEVDLFIYGHHGELFDYINPKVQLLPEIKELAWLRDSFINKIKHRCFYSAMLRLKNEVLDKFGKGLDFDRSCQKVIFHCTRPILTHYDLALGFFLPFDFMDKMVDASLKVGWIHTDYSSYRDEKKREYLLENYSKTDYNIAVSEACKAAFLEILPQQKEKTIVVENILSKEFIYRQANAKNVSNEMSNRGIKLLSIGRFCKAKNFDNIPDICRRLVTKGLDVYWYIIGFGNDEMLIREKIKENGMEKRVILLGKKSNPYPYIKNCDFYIQPSRYEGKSVSVREAQMFAKPVIITKYKTSTSQIEDGIDGIIVPMDNEGCASGIEKVIRNKTIINKLILGCKTKDYSNSREVDKLYRLIDGQ